MPTTPKIKIADDPALRAHLEARLETMSQIDAARWALRVAKHALDAAGLNWSELNAVAVGFAVNEQWQEGRARMYDVRQAGFKVHALARTYGDPARQAALRCAGQAVGTGHMKAHAIVAADYAVKAVGLASGDSRDAIAAERQWQLEQIEKRK